MVLQPRRLLHCTQSSLCNFYSGTIWRARRKTSRADQSMASLVKSYHDSHVHIHLVCFILNCICNGPLVFHFIALHCIADPLSSNAFVVHFAPRHLHYGCAFCISGFYILHILFSHYCIFQCACFGILQFAFCMLYFETHTMYSGCTRSTQTDFALNSFHDAQVPQKSICPP